MALFAYLYFSFSFLLYAQGASLEDFDSVLYLSDDIEGILQVQSGYEGEFTLNSTEQADLMLELARLQYTRDEIERLRSYDPDCDPDFYLHEDSHINLKDPCGPRLPGQRRFRFNFTAKSPMGANQFKRRPFSSSSFEAEVLSTVDRLAFETQDMGLVEAHTYIMENGSISGGALDATLSEEVFDGLLRKRVINASPDDRDAIMNEAGELMSFDRQIQFVSKLGAQMLQNYDYEREAQGIFATDEVSCEDILSGLASNKGIGVCRDMHLCLAQLMQSMGNKDNVHVVTYAIPGNYHATLLATDPDNPSHVYKLNYGEISEDDWNRGVSALDHTTSAPDVGITYRIWSPDGEMLGSLPSEMGVLLNEVTGGSTHDFDPFVRDNTYRLASVGVDNGKLHGNLFVGNLSSGDTIVGVATYIRWGDCSESDHSSLRVGRRGRAGVSYVNRSIEQPQFVNDRTRKYSLNQLYMNVQQEFYTPIALVESEGVSFMIEPFVSARLAVMGVHSTLEDTHLEGNRKSITGDADAVVDYGVRANLLKGENFSAEGVLYQQRTLGFKNLSAMLGGDFVFTDNVTVASVDAKAVLNDQLSLLMGTTLALREYGNTGSARIGLGIDSDLGQTKIITSYQAPVFEKTSGWVPGGANPSFSAQVDHSFTRPRTNYPFQGRRVELMLNYEKEYLGRSESSSWYTGGGLRVRY